MRCGGCGNVTRLNRVTPSEQDATRLIDDKYALEAEVKLDKAMQGNPDAIRLTPDTASMHLNRGSNRLISTGLLDGKYRTMVPLVGFELTTYRLQGGCSTN
jgi:hypothetical protein